MGISKIKPLTSQYHSVGGSRGGVCCASHHSLFVSLSATLRENGWTDLHEIFSEGVE